MDKNQEVKQAVQQQFGKNAQEYVQSKTHAQGADLPLMVEWLSPQTSWKVLDIATGEGMLPARWHRLSSLWSRPI